jgi:hypothetical protein
MDHRIGSCGRSNEEDVVIGPMRLVRPHLMTVTACLNLVLAGCYGGPGDRPRAEAIADQCDQVRSIGSLIAVGDAFVAAVHRGDRTEAKSRVEQAQASWFGIQAGFHGEPEGGMPAELEARQQRIVDASPRFEWFAAVMAATPIEGAAAGASRMLPEMRSLLDGIDYPECALIELPSAD